MSIRKLKRSGGGRWGQAETGAQLTSAHMPPNRCPTPHRAPGRGLARFARWIDGCVKEAG